MDKRVDWNTTLSGWEFSRIDSKVVSDFEIIKSISGLLIYAGNNLLEHKIQFFEVDFNANLAGFDEEIDKNRLLIEAGEQLLEHKQVAETHFSRAKWGFSTFEMPIVYEGKNLVMYFKCQFMNKDDKTLKTNKKLKEISIRIHESKYNLEVCYK
ncbi:MAG: hypothetical protein JXA66_00790 [Oligoflexia bacterium]|nr:hypothetical protein [Oligoflexia bacterium]